MAESALQISIAYIVFPEYIDSSAFFSADSNEERSRGISVLRLFNGVELSIV